MWWPFSVVKLSSLSPHHVSQMSNKSKSEWFNSAIKSSQRDSHRMLCKFLTMTCTQCSIWSASFVASGDGLSSPFPVAGFLLSEKPPLHNPYSMSAMKSCIASRTIAGTSLASFQSIVKVVLHKSEWASTCRCHGQWPWTACSWQWHLWAECLPVRSKTFSICWQFWPGYSTRFHQKAIPGRNTRPWSSSPDESPSLRLDATYFANRSARSRFQSRDVSGHDCNIEGRHAWRNQYWHVCFWEPPDQQDGRSIHPNETRFGTGEVCKNYVGEKGGATRIQTGNQREYKRCDRCGWQIHCGDWWFRRDNCWRSREACTWFVETCAWISWGVDGWRQCNCGPCSVWYSCTCHEVYPITEKAPSNTNKQIVGGRKPCPCMLHIGRMLLNLVSSGFLGQIEFEYFHFSMLPCVPLKSAWRPGRELEDTREQKHLSRNTWAWANQKDYFHTPHQFEKNRRPQKINVRLQNMLFPQWLE